MANYGEQPWSMSLASSSRLSTGSNMLAGGQEAKSNVDFLSLNKLSYNLERMLSDSPSDFSDAQIVIGNAIVCVHRCILASRSSFFRDFFKKNEGFPVRNGVSRYFMTSVLPFGKVGYDAFSILLSYMYTGKLKPSPLDMCTCVDNVCTHEACGPAVNFAVELIYGSTIFQIPELASLYQRYLLNLVDKATVEDVLPILVAAFHCRMRQILVKCVNKVAPSKLENITIEKEVPSKLAEDIKQLRLNSQPRGEIDGNIVDQLREKEIKRILKALDSEDVELVKLLLSESDITLDEAYALHYAVAYCDPKTVSELLHLGMADLNLRDSQGKTPIHVAARRKEPSIIVSLVSNGARVSELTLEGLSALIICKRLTTKKDFHMRRERGQEGNKDRICIDILERELLRGQNGDDASMTSPEEVDDLQMKLMHLEDRVLFAHMFFPTEAKVAMEIANAETTPDLADLMRARQARGNVREMDLNESPLTQDKKLVSRIETLSRSVELGLRYFPHCSNVLDRYMEDEILKASYLEEGTPEELQMKREHIVELKEKIVKAFRKDKKKHHQSGFAAASSSAAPAPAPVPAPASAAPAPAPAPAPVPAPAPAPPPRPFRIRIGNKVRIL